MVPSIFHSFPRQKRERESIFYSFEYSASNREGLKNSLCPTPEFNVVCKHLFKELRLLNQFIWKPGCQTTPTE
jgi:hypothetical protein